MSERTPVPGASDALEPRPPLRALAHGSDGRSGSLTRQRPVNRGGATRRTFAREPAARGLLGCATVRRPVVRAGGSVSRKVRWWSALALGALVTASSALPAAAT